MQRIVNILIVFANTISLSAHILIASAEALIVVATIRNAVTNRRHLPLPWMLFFVLSRRHIVTFDD